jgi:thiol-disulfide isomerase/thioredoxin
MNRRNAIGATAGLALVGLGGGLLYRRIANRDAAAGGDATALLALALPDIAGNDVRLAQWRGKLLLVNFWATWCVPCREEMPEFVRAQAKFGPGGLQFVGIAIDDADKVRRFATEIGVNYPVLVGGYGAMELSRTLGNTVMALPFTVVVGRDATIAYTQLGPLQPDKLDSIVAKLL